MNGLDYKAVRRALFKSARYMTRDRHEAEDLVQTAFLRALEAPTGSVPPARMYSWLSRVVRNLAIDQSRSRRRWQNSPLFEQIAAPSEVSAEDPPGAFMQLDCEQLSELLDAIEPRYKRICEMRYFADMSYAEIAASLDVPIGTVGTRLHRARELVAACWVRSQGIQRVSADT